MFDLSEEIWNGSNEQILLSTLKTVDIIWGQKVLYVFYCFIIFYRYSIKNTKNLNY